MLISRFELRQSLLMVHGLQLSPLVSINITVHHLITVFMYTFQPLDCSLIEEGSG